MSSSKNPRIYPTPFARRLVDMLEEMKASARGAPVPPTEALDPLSCFEDWRVDVIPEDWSFVDFAELFNYLRGNRHLQIPINWRSAIPNRLR